MLSKGDLILLPPDKHHSVRADGEKPSSVFIISFEMVSEFFDHLGCRVFTLHDHIKYFRFNVDKDLKRVMNDVKAWAWNCENQRIVNPIIVYSTDIRAEDGQQYDCLQSILAIFSKATQNVFRIDDATNKLSEIIANENLILNDTMSGTGLPVS